MSKILLKNQLILAVLAFSLVAVGCCAYGQSLHALRADRVIGSGATASAGAGKAGVIQSRRQPQKAKTTGQGQSGASRRSFG